MSRPASMANSPPPNPTEPWSLREALDLPIALDEERHPPNRESELAAAREAIAAMPGVREPPSSDAQVLRAWLRRWRNGFETATPGAHIEAVLRNAGRIGLGTGILLGLIAASDRLFFTGGEPL